MVEASDVLQRVGEFFERLSIGTGSVLKTFVGSRNRRVVAAMRPLVARIGELEPAIQALTPEALKHKTIEFREQLAQGRTLDDILPEAFACVREAARRALGMRHFDVQMMGGIVLHRGSIAEMSTGEGKTLVATAPAYLNSLVQRGVFVVTVNDYLARRDADWMRPVYETLGVNVKSIQSHMDPSVRKPCYAADITYGTNNEFGFDYLRDNMKSRVEEQVQKHLYYAIIDEVDSILIDEARTPLIISGLPDTSTDKYYRADQIARQLQPGVDFEVKEKEHQCVLGDEGIEKAQRLAGVDTFYSGTNMEWPHHIETALRAHHLYHRDKEYVVKQDDDGQAGVIIVDEFTGRLMPGRRWSDGLHQAVEAKEGLRIREEHQTLATITFQNYFRLYEKIAGMTGTAMTEAAEFSNIYKLDVIQIPTNKPTQREDHQDLIYLTEDEKFASIAREICDTHKRGQPVLVGTVSIEKSEKLAKILSDPKPMTLYLARRADAARAALDKLAGKKPSWLTAELQAEIRELLSKPAALDVARAEALAMQVKEAAPKEELAWHLEQVWHYGETVRVIKQGLPHNVLNAKFHQMEAQIVAQAGSLGAVTIATNMAGRGTDILLGGNPEARARAELGATPDDAALAESIARHRAACEIEKKQVLEAGGLYIIGTERHEARRIDNQLRGRAGRQGDPGASKFFLSLQDDLMRIFARDWVTTMLKRLGMLEGQEIESPMVSRGVEKAQRRVEQRNFEIRKNVLEYDEVMDKQRKTIYSLRQDILEGVELRERVLEMCDAVVERLMHAYLGENKRDWELDEVGKRLHHVFGIELKAEELAGLDRNAVRQLLDEKVRATYDQREASMGAEPMRMVERFLLLNVIDAKWKDHLHAMTQLRENVGLRSYAQIDPKNEYKREGFENFQKLLEAIEDEVTTLIFRIQVVREEEQKRLDTRWQADGRAAAPVPARAPARALPPRASGPAAPAAPAAAPPAEAAAGNGAAAATPAPLEASPEAKRMDAERRRREEAARSAGRSRGPVKPIKNEQPRVGRNDPCPCGSGEKYKKCCFPKFGG